MVRRVAHENYKDADVTYHVVNGELKDEVYVHHIENLLGAMENYPNGLAPMSFRISPKTYFIRDTATFLRRHRPTRITRDTGSHIFGCRGDWGHLRDHPKYQSVIGPAFASTSLWSRGGGAIGITVSPSPYASHQIPDMSTWPADMTDSSRVVGLNQSLEIGAHEMVRIDGSDVKFEYYKDPKSPLFFMLYRPSYDMNVVKHCGDGHYAPNGESDYDYAAWRWKVRTDCFDWKPDHSGTIIPDFNCHEMYRIAGLRRWLGSG